MKKDGDRLLASPPPTIAGKLEIRGIGIVDMDIVTDLPVALIVELTAATSSGCPTTAGSGRSSASSCR